MEELGVRTDADGPRRQNDGVTLRTVDIRTSGPWTFDLGHSDFWTFVLRDLGFTEFSGFGTRVRL